MPDFKYLRKRVYGAAKAAKRGQQNARFDTSDIAQEGAIQFFRESEQNEMDTTELGKAAFVRTVANGHYKRLCRDHHAACRTVNKEESLDSPAPVSQTERDPAKVVEQNEQFLRVANEMGKLQPELRRILFLRFFEKKTYLEIAGVFGQPVSTVQRKCERALKQLRQTLS